MTPEEEAEQDRIWNEEQDRCIEANYAYLDSLSDEALWKLGMLPAEYRQWRKKDKQCNAAEKKATQ